MQLQHAAFFKDNESYIVLEEQPAIRYSRFWMMHFLPEVLVGHMVDFSLRLKALQLSPTQLLVLCALLVFEVDQAQKTLGKLLPSVALCPTFSSATICLLL